MDHGGISIISQHRDLEAHHIWSFFFIWRSPLFDCARIQSRGSMKTGKHCCFDLMRGKWGISILLQNSFYCSEAKGWWNPYGVCFIFPAEVFYHLLLGCWFLDCYLKGEGEFEFSAGSHVRRDLVTQAARGNCFCK